MNPSHLEAAEAWESRLAVGDEVLHDCFWVLHSHLRADTIQPIYERLSEHSQKAFLSVARSILLNFEKLVATGPSEGFNPESTYVAREWLYRQPFIWREVSLEMIPCHSERGGGSETRLFEEVVPLLRQHAIGDIVSLVRPGWRNQLRNFGRGLRPGLDVVCEVARGQGVEPKLIHAFVTWAESTKLERTRWEPGE